MLFKEIEDNCKELCPLYEEFCSGGMMAGYGGEPIEPPCAVFEEDDAYKLYEQLSDSRRRFEDYEDKKIKAEQKRKEENEKKAKRAREARMIVYSETKEIKRLRKRINLNNKLLSTARSYMAAVNATNKMFGYEQKVVEKSNNPFEIENQKLLEQIEQLEKTKKEKLKKLRIKREQEVANET